MNKAPIYNSRGYRTWHIERTTTTALCGKDLYPYPKKDWPQYRRDTPPPPNTGDTCKTCVKIQERESRQP